MKIVDAISDHFQKLKGANTLLVLGLDFSLMDAVSDELGTKLQFSRCKLNEPGDAVNGKKISLPKDFIPKGNTIYSGYADNLITVAKDLKIPVAYILRPIREDKDADDWNRRKAEFLKKKFKDMANISAIIVSYSDETKAS